MDKIKPTSDAIEKWLKKYKGPYVVSAKLDGISALYVNTDEGPKLYTRGNGVYGQDISHLIPKLIKKNVTVKEIAIRGEIIIDKNKFKEKYSEKFANPRNFVAGIVNKKTVDLDILKDLDFVGYEVISPTMKPSEQMKYLDELHDKKNISQPVKYQVEQKISNEKLSEILIDWRNNYKYEIDGLIVVNDEIYPRPKKNPEYAFAFKMVISDQVAETKVVDVIWTPSKDGYLKPRVQIEPVNLGGVVVEYATGFNAKFIEDNKIGIGAIITIIRSGDVIPHIVSVIEPATKTKFPDVPYKWNNTHVDIILDNKDDDLIVREKNIVAFFKNLEVEGLGPGNVKKLMETGYDTVAKILAMNIDNYLEVDGFKIKTAEKLYNGIKKKVDESSLVQIMAASNVFGRGFGEKSFNKIFEKYPNILVDEESKKDKVDKLLTIDGVAKITAEKFVEKIPEFLKFLSSAKLDYKLHEKLANDNQSDTDKKMDHELYGKKIVLTGFRDKELLNTLKKIGAEPSGSVSKNTFAVIVKDKDEDTGKADQERKLGIKIMTVDELEKIL
jgi:NAD-dependent DNA ligase